ncbi:MAG: FtsQ-type POTRA domain-containing protein [Myxococcales bacterium]|nr:FtsQ-type POTRA domain-containing protein [Myxococcales bacterium]
MLPATLATLALVALGGALFSGYRFLRTSPRFAIARFEVHGTNHMAEADVVAVAGVSLGGNIFALDVEGVEQRLERLPWVRQASVSRQLPDTLEIEVTERVAVAAVNADGLYLVDADGRLFKRGDTKTGELMGLPVISGLDRAAFGDDEDVAAAAIARACALLARWNQLASARAAHAVIGEVRIEHDDAYTLYTRAGGIALHVGVIDAEQVEAMLAKFTASYEAVAPGERAAVRALYLDNQTRTNYVTVAFAK